jgi:hypothetical protein
MLDRDSFSIIFNFLEDDIHFIYYCYKNNVKIRGEDIDFSKINIDWNHVSDLELTIEMMKDLSSYLNWNIITSAYKENLEVIREFKDDKIQWDIICSKMRFCDNDIFTRDDYAFCKEFADYLDWNKISRYSGMDELFIHNFADRLNWGTLSSVQGLSEFLLDTYKEKIVWGNTYTNRVLNKSLVDKYNPNVESNYDIIMEDNIEIDDEFNINDNIPFQDINMTDVQHIDLNITRGTQAIDRTMITDIIINIDENSDDINYEQVD